MAMPLMQPLINQRDLRVEITSIHCYSNTSTLVRFRVCTSNDFDTIPNGLPVSFYATDPRTGSAGMPLATFLVPADRTRPCEPFAFVLPTPKGGYLYACVNQRHSAKFPDTAWQEADLLNNIDTATVQPFKVRILPRDTLVPRVEGLRMSSQTKGGVAIQYSWKPASFLTCSNCPNPVASMAYSSQVTLLAHNEYACTSADTVQINTYAEGRFHFPNAFTPNADGLNDILYMSGDQDVASVLEFRVYDRYGQVLFLSKNVPPNDPRYGWNGTRNGMQVASGSYLYQVKVRQKNGQEYQVKGLVSLIR